MHPPHPGLAVTLLGRTAATVDGGAVDLGRPQQQLLFALLAAHAGTVVPLSAIEEELWPDAGRRPGAVLPLVSRLRAAVEGRGLPGREVVARSGPGYRLGVTPAAVDLRRAEGLLDATAGDGDGTDRLTRLAEAVALLRHPPFADLQVGPRLHAVARRVQRRAADAERRWLELRLAREHPAELVDPAHVAHGRHPDHEGIAAVAATILVRAGQQAEALALLVETRAQLRRRHGVDLGRRLRALHARVLAEDPSLYAEDPRAGPARSAVPAALHPFVGRGDEVGAVLDALDGSRLVTLVAPGGMGKSVLVQHLCRRHLPRADVIYVDLSAIGPDRLLAALAAAAGAPAQVEVRRGVADLDVVLVDRLALVVLDQCEHLLPDVAELVAELLRRHTALRVLAASRTPLAVPGEHVVALPPMPDQPAPAPGASEAALQSGWC